MGRVAHNPTYIEAHNPTNNDEITLLQMSFNRQFGRELHFTFVSLTNKGMSESLAILSLTALISFMGSIHPGPVNLAVVNATLSHNFKTGVWVAISGTLPEIIYTLIALQSQGFLAKHQSVFQTLEVAIIPFFLVIGVYSFIKTPVQRNAAIRSTQPVEALKGFLSGLLNPQLLPFWVVFLIYLHSHFSLDTFGAKFSFVFGAALGAFLILVLFAYLAERYQTTLYRFLHRYPMNKFIGLFFIGMSLYQTFKILA